MKQEEKIALADEIVEYSAGATSWYYPDCWDILDSKTQDEIMEEVYKDSDMCADCGWVWWREHMGISKFGELVCDECLEEEE